MNETQTSITNTTFSCKYGSCTLLKHGNYAQWLADIEILLDAANVLEIVNGTEPAPVLSTRSSTPDRTQEYSNRRKLARTLLWSSLTSNARQHVMAVRNDPHDIWTTLKKRYDVSNNDAAAARLKGQFHDEKWKSDDTINTWQGRLLDYQARLVGISLWAISDKELCLKLLTGLPSSWNTIKEQIWSS